VLALLGITVAGLLLARLLARETHAAWPVLDSMTTCTGLIATWMVARMKLENWLYWILADCVTVFLFAAQGYLASAALFVAYTIIAMFGVHAWLQKYRLQTP
jgi:nicotinamide mononucleotide transporter